MDLVVLGLLLLGGLFTGGLLVIAVGRSPMWSTLDGAVFRQDFASTVKRVDVLLPALLVASLVLTLLFAVDSADTSRRSGFIAAGGYAIILIASAAILVPLQDAIITTDLSEERILVKKQAWQRGHLARTILSIITFSLAIAAVALR